MMEGVKELIESLIPFVAKTGITAEELSPTKVRLRLPLDASNLGAAGSVHPGAIFTLGETCATALCMVSLGKLVAVGAKAVDLRLKRGGRGDLVAIAQLTPIDAQRILDAVRTTGKVDAPITVEVADAGGEPVSTVVVTMLIRLA
jgi:acyl-coenzyme A thioesterase PaaI-like protein